MPAFRFLDLDPPAAMFREDVLAGLARNQKALPPKYFYDEAGSQLFDQICQLDEYYPTRTEIGLLEAHQHELQDLLPAQTALVEYGSGSSVKIRYLLDGSKKIRSYVPLDISKEHLRRAAQQVHASYNHLDVTAVCADYTQLSALPPGVAEPPLRRTLFFPGSTLGNLDGREAGSLLRRARQLVGDDGTFILGVDLVKDPAVLCLAYDDRAGVTAAFNKNLLHRINRELDGGFAVEAFAHRAVYNVALQRMEMHLVSLREQTVQVAGAYFTFAAGETIHTESSHKYQLTDLARLAQSSGFRLEARFTDPQEYFAVCFLAASPSAV